jgi:hypothetical protein
MVRASADAIGIARNMQAERVLVPEAGSGF